MALQWYLFTVDPQNLQPTRKVPQYQGRCEPEELDLLLTGGTHSGPITQFLADERQMRLSDCSAVYPVECVAEHSGLIKATAKSVASANQVAIAAGGRVDEDEIDSYCRGLAAALEDLSGFLEHCAKIGAAVQLDVY